MPLFSIKEIAEMCSIQPKNIHSYIARGKLIKRKDKLIDDQNTVNADFLLKYKVKEINSISVTIEKQHRKNKLKKSTRNNKSHHAPENSDPDISNYLPNNELNRLKAEKIKNETELLKLKIKVQSGILIPIEAAENAASVHFNSITSMFYNAVDNEISDLCNELQLSREKLTSLRGKLKKIINENVQKAKQKTKEDLINAASNYEEDEETISSEDE